MEVKILRRSGKWVQTFCPYCQCDDLWLDTQTGAGHCFQCGRKTGLNRLAREFGAIATWQPSSLPSSARDFDVNVSAACRYLTRIWRHLPYRAQRPNVDADRFQLVLAQDLRHRIECDLSESERIDYGFQYRKGGRLFWSRALAAGRIIIPYWRDGRIVNIRSRGRGTKYLQIKGWRATFWGEQRQPRVIVTEGEFKAIRLEQIGYNALALPGISSCHHSLVSYLRERGVQSVLVWFDTEPEIDHPAYDQQARLVQQLAQAGLPTMVVQLWHTLAPMRKYDVEDWIDLSSWWLIDYLETAFAMVEADPPAPDRSSPSQSPPDAVHAPPSSTG